jgi:hypothetical protein
MPIEAFADLSLYSLDEAILYNQRFDTALSKRQPSGALQHSFHPLPIKRLIGLGTRRTHCRPLLGVEHPKLDSSLVDCPAHLTAERIDLFHQVSLTDAAYRRIARHLADVIEIQSQQQSRAAHASGRKASFDAGVTSTDDDNVEV